MLRREGVAVYQHYRERFMEFLVNYLWLVLTFWEKMQFQGTGRSSSSPFSWEDSQKEYRQLTDPKAKQQKSRERDDG